MKPRWFFLTVAASCISPLVSFADDWPQWRGPDRNGISQETGLLAEWPENGPRLLWQVKDLGGGYSTPAIVGDRLYLLSNEGVNDEFVRALSTKDGSEIWSTRVGKVGNPDQKPPYPGARSTPTVEGDVLYALSSDGDLVCLETANGRVRWSKNVREEFGGRPGEWAYSESPLIDGEKLICTPGGSEATIVALNKSDGALIWKFASPSEDEAAYSSPISVQIDGSKQYVQFLQKGLVGLDAQTGKLLWSYGKTAQGSLANIPTPVAYKQYVYSASGRGGGGLVRIEVAGQTVQAEEVYSAPSLPNAIGGAVEVDGYLYGTGRAGLMCIEMESGESKWENRSVGAGAIIYADGHLYVHSESSGEVALVEVTPEAYREKGRFTPPEQPDRGSSRAWAYPAIADGRLYLHDFGTLWCYEVGTAKEPE